jgi:alginate O-acetyltransferase complex protein AlgI
MVAYLLVPEKLKNPVLLVSSLIFYAWGGPRYVLLICFEALASWFFALRIENSDGSARRIWLIAELVCLLGLLGYFKYFTWILTSIHGITGFPANVPQIVLPIGISFYTFQLISYVVDVYRGTIDAQPAYWKLLLYCSLFHQCIAGPIVRYETVAHEIEDRSVSERDIYEGVRRFSIGLAKKVVLANSCAAAADSLVPTGSTALANQVVSGYWLGMLFYALQIYLDFSAYSDMAIGMGRMIGFHYLENFDHPYQCSSVQDFWRRWHISLSTFFRDYVYIPLGGNRCKIPRQIFNLFAVWALTGLWHGASWNYVLWGLYYFVFLVLEKFIFRPKKDAPLPILLLRRVGVLAVVYFGWLLFYFEDLSALGTALSSLFCLGGNAFWDLYARTKLLNNLFFLAVAMLACTPIIPFLHKKLSAREENSAKWQTAEGVVSVAAPILLLLLSLIFLVGNTYNPFLYYQF